MVQTASKNGITFAVDDVAPATSRRLECPIHEEVRRRLESDIESCSDYLPGRTRRVSFKDDFVRKEIADLRRV